MKQSAKNILKFAYELSDFVSRSDQVFTYDKKRRLNFSRTFIEKIAENFDTPDLEPIGRLDTDRLLTLVQELFNLYIKGVSLTYNTVSDKFTYSDLRKLTYSLYKLNNNPSLFAFCLLLFQIKWRNSYIKGLLYILLYYWNDLQAENKIKIHELLTKKLAIYKGSSNKYILLKKYIHFLDGEKGPLLLGSYASKNLSSPLEMPRVLSLRETAITYTFFDKAIYTFYKKKISTLHQEDWINYDKVKHLISDVESTFKCSNSSYIIKTVISLLVLQASKYVEQHINIQTQIKRLTLDFIGDTSVKSKWSYIDGGSVDDLNNLAQARTIIRKWEVQQCISLFFERCVSDIDRKTYWLKYVDHIKSLRIIGSQSIKKELKTDERLKDIINTIYIETNSKQSQTAALAMNIDDYIMIEFSDVGAFYAYKETSSYSSFFTKQKIDKISDIKQPDLNLLVQDRPYYAYYTFYEEGRLIHSGNWQHKLSLWLSEKANISLER